MTERNLDDSMPTMISQPWVIVYEDDGKMVCRFHGRPGADYHEYALVVADIIAHLHMAFGASKDELLRLVAAEVRNPTTAISGKRLNTN